MTRTAAAVLAAVALAPASSGASAARPSLALTATPVHLALAGAGRTTMRVANPGARPVIVDVARAGFSLDRRGRPRVAPRDGVRAAASWISVRPTRFILPAGASRLLTVTSRLPRRAEPGDHDALVLLTTRPQRGAGVAVRVRIGVVVVVRAPGRVVRRIAVRGLRVRHLPHARLLEVLLVNRGNVTETLGRGSIRIVLFGARRHATLHAGPRDLRPRTSGAVQFRYRGMLRGRVYARVRVEREPGRRSDVRTFRIHL
jgi:hypothetical protein